MNWALARCGPPTSSRNKLPKSDNNLEDPSTPTNAALRRAKIICTIGPACNTEVAMRDLLRLGMDIARLNFSHGTHEDHAHHIHRLRRAAEREHRTLCIIQDLQGDRKSTRLNSSHIPLSRMPSSA